MLNRELFCKSVQSLAQELVPIADAIFDKPERGFEEYYAAEVLTDWLSSHGWQVEKGVGKVETAFRATFEKGSGGPSIGLLAEYDALPMGHACGHHLQGPIIFAAAEALKNADIDRPYKLVVYGTPAEEGFGGKVPMLANGCFGDIDCALMTHASDHTTVDIKSYAGMSFEVTFTGVQAHESLTPEKVRSGLDALVLAMQGMEFLRGHVTDGIRMSSSIKSCAGVAGHTNNTIATGVFSFRTYQAHELAILERQFRKVFEGAAIMTETQVEVKVERVRMGKLPSLSLNKIIMDNAAELNAPEILAFRERTGSTDFAEVTHVLPGAVSRFPLVPEGNPSHTQIYLDYGKRPEAREGLALGAKLVALSALDLIERPELLAQVKREYAERAAEYKRLSAQ